jgi:Tfp pilus assembly protein PilX
MKLRASAVSNERGVALVTAMIVLFTLSLIAVGLMLTVNTETRLAGQAVRGDQALNVAEAGVGEVCTRINNGDLVLNTANPRAVGQVFNVPVGSVPVPGNADTTAMATLQPAGAWLNYTAAGKGPDVLTCEFKTDSARTMIYYYDPSVTPPVNSISGMPIFKVTSTGRIGLNKVKIQTEVARKPVIALVQAALQANKGIDFKGNIDVCGYNHSITCPYGAKLWAECSPYHTGSGNLPASWSTNTITKTGSSDPRGFPDWRSENNVGFFSGPWDALGMSQAEFYSWVGASIPSEPNPPDGLIYLDNNSVTQDKTGSWAFTGGTGEGLLYVDGDLTVNGNFQFKGLIYVEGDIKINGTFWVLGAIVCDGKARLDLANGNATLLYSSEAIMQALSKAGGSFVTLSWRRL